MVTLASSQEVFRKLMDEAIRLPTVEATDAASYAAHAGALAEFVDARLGSESIRDRLPMRIPLELLRVNHRNHVGFMAAVFGFSAWSVMARTVVWVYRSYCARGIPAEYFPVVLDVFRDGLRALLPGSAPALDPAYAFLRSHHETFLHLSKKGDDPPRPSLSEPEERFVRALLRADTSEAIAIARECVVNRTDVERFFGGVVRPAMREVGTLWEDGGISVAQEHVATAIANRALAAVYENHVVTTPTKGRALVLCAVGELHDLGARMVADLLEMDGWDVQYAGAGVSLDALLALLEPSPFLVAVSATMFEHLPRMRELVALVRSTTATSATRVLAGGQAFIDAPEVIPRIRADRVAVEAAHGVRIASEWWDTRGGIR